MISDMRRRGSRLERAFLWALSIVSVPTFAVVGAAICWRGSEGSDWAWLAIAGGSLTGALVGLIPAIAVGRVWASVGGLAQGLRVQEALRSRRIPDDVDADVWFALLERQQRALRWTWPAVGFFALIAVLYGLAGLSEAFRHLGILPWVGATGFTGVAIWAPFDARKRARSIQDLKAQLAERRLRA